MRHPSAQSILLAAAFAVFAGCESLNPPPGMTHAEISQAQSETQPDQRPDIDYALIAWYREANAGTAISAAWRHHLDDRQAAALHALQLKHRQTLETQSGHFIAADDAQFVRLNPAALPQAMPDGAAKLEALKQLLLAPKLEIPLQECLAAPYWQEQPPQSKAAFEAWAKDRCLTFPALPDNVDSQAFEARLNKIIQAYQAKCAIVQLRTQAHTLCQNGKLIEAMNLLEQHPELTADNDILAPLENISEYTALIEDIHTMPENCICWTLHDLRQQLAPCQAKLEAPFNPVSNNVSELDKTLQNIETQATAAFAIWQTDKRFQTALEKHRQDIHEATRLLADLRKTVSTRILEDLCTQKLYWNAFQAYTDAKSRLDTTADTCFGLYASTGNIDKNPHNGVSSIGKALAQALHDCLKAHAAEAAGTLYEEAEKELRINNRYGYAFALCKMVCQMTDVLQAPETSTIRKNAGELAHKAIAAMEQNALRRIITISDMSSSIAGLGLTCTLDIKHHLNNALKDSGLKNIVIDDKSTAQPPAPYTYALYDGIVADFNGQETVERQSTRTVRLFGDIRKVAVPILRPEGTTTQTTYQQDVREQLINMREVERIAHIRIFATLRGPGFTTDVELNEFYSRRFVLEESHLFNDVRVIDVIKASSPDQLAAPDKQPELRYDRIWTAGELLDWARKDALAVFTMKLLFHLKQFPFLLANNARKATSDGNHALAAEQWGLCYAITQGSAAQQPPKDTQEGQTVPMAKCYSQCRDNLLRQAAALGKLEKSTLPFLLEAANLAYTSKQH